MPIYEYFCQKCGDKRELIQKYEMVPACKCGHRMVRVPSPTGYRRDHTVSND